MIILDTPPALILPDHYKASRPAIIRPALDIEQYFPVEIDRKTRRAIVKELAKRGLIDDRSEARRQIEAAIPFGMFQPNAVTVVWLGSAAINSGATTFNFTSQPLGLAVARWIVVAINQPSGRVMSSMTVGGVSGSNLYTGTSSIAPVWWKSQLSSAVGTTGTISITFTSSDTEAGIGFWAVYGPWNGSASATNQHGTTAVNSPSMTISVLKGSYLLASARTVAPGTGFTWTNATEEFDFATSGSNGMRITGADVLQTGATGNITVTANGGANAGRLTGVVIP